ncbi:hypothetical protein Tco_0639678 [Tanacetum coccineum]
MIKLMTFSVMCKAYDGEPSVDLLWFFLNLGRASDWLTLSKRGGANVPKALIKPVTHLEKWKGSFFYIENKIILSKYPELLLEENKLDKKSFKDKIPTQPQADSLFSAAKPMNNKTHIINAELISVVLPSNVADNIIDSSNTSSDDELTPVHPSISSFPEVGEKSKAAGKRKLAADALQEGSYHRARKAPV